MREELYRILRMVQEGKLTPEQAIPLIEALMAEPDTRQSRRYEEAPLEEAFEQLRRAFQGVDWRRIQQEWKRISEEIREQTRRGWEEAQRAFRGMGRWDIDMFLSSVRGVEHEQSVEVEPGVRLIVQNTLGDVHVQAVDNITHIRVHSKATIRADQEDLEAWSPLIEQREGVVFVRMARAGRFASADVEITVPTGTPVEIQSTVGDVTVEAIRASATVESATGDITVREASGSVNLITASGDIRLQMSHAESIDLRTKSGDILCEACSCQGRLQARTASGDTYLRQVEAQQVQVNAVSGEIRLEFAAPFHGEAQLQNISGDIQVSLPAQSRCVIRVAVPDGELDNQSSVELHRNEKGEWEGTLGTGEPLGTLFARTISGAISLKTE